MKFLTLFAIFLLSTIAVFAQLPAESQRASVMQTIGDTNITINYFRPNVKGREVWGKLVPYDQVWRTGANNATIFEVTNDVKINGQLLAAGKYSLHSIPTKGDWTVIFNKVADQWGSFQYDEKQDVLRVKATPKMLAESREQMTFTFDKLTKSTGELALTWEKLHLPIMIDVGDVNGRVMANLRKMLEDKTAKNYRQTLMQGANFVWNEKMSANYTEALGWVDEALKIQENFGALRMKAYLSAANGNKADAIANGEKAVTMGKASTPPANPELMKNLEADLVKWKSSK